MRKGQCYQKWIEGLQQSLPAPKRNACPAHCLLPYRATRRKPASARCARLLSTEPERGFIDFACISSCGVNVLFVVNNHVVEVSTFLEPCVIQRLGNSVECSKAKSLLLSRLTLSGALIQKLFSSNNLRRLG
jgi:hypothetical protein